MTQRVLAIGLDGATFDLLTPLMDQGVLPNLARMRGEGAWGPLSSTIPPLTAPAWSSFATGMNPGKHSVLQFFSASSGSSRVDTRSVVNSTSIATPTLWQRLSEHGLRVGMVNIPMTYPPPEVNGFVVAGMPMPLKPAALTYPPSLASTLGDYRPDLSYFMGGREFRAEYAPAAQRLLADMSAILDERAAATLRLIESQPCDFFMVVFTETDRLGHHLGAVPSEPDVRRKLVEWYGRLDMHLGAIMDAFGSGCATLIMSDHGMGTSASRRVYFNDWLINEGLMVPGHAGRSASAWLRKLGITRDLAARILRRFPSGLSRIAIERLGGGEVPIDFERSVAYYTPIYEFVGGITIVPDEMRAAGTPAYFEIRAEIANRLRGLVDPATGEHMIKEVHAREEIYAGPYVDQMPDLILMMAEQYVGNHRIGNRSCFAERTEVSAVLGAHRTEGIFLASGEGIAGVGHTAGLSIVDLAPTIMHLLGLAVPQTMDGRVLTEILDSEHVSMHPVRRVSGIDRAVSTSHSLTAIEEHEIREQLRGLGYLD